MKCPVCAREIPDQVPRCPYCDVSLDVSPQWKAWIEGYAQMTPADREQVLPSMSAEQRAQFDWAWKILGPAAQTELHPAPQDAAPATAEERAPSPADGVVAQERAPAAPGATEEVRSGRQHRRHDQQFTTRFKTRGNPVPKTGMAANISAGGMFLASPSSQPVGTRLEIRIEDPEHGFVIEGEVVHSIDSGMGIRFVSVEELMAQLLLSEAEEEADPQEAEARAAELGLYSLSFASREEYDAFYNGILQTGGVMVPSPRPAAEGADVKITVSLTYAKAAEVRLDGRVVKLFDGEMPVMGVEITNLQSSIQGLQALGAAS